MLGKELGLSKKEIDKLFFYSSYKEKLLGGFLIFILLIFIVFFIVLPLFLPVQPYVPKNNTYAEGTFYSTVRLKDFNARKSK